MNWVAIWFAIYSTIRRKDQSLHVKRKQTNRGSGRRGRQPGLVRSRFVGELAEWFESDFQPWQLDDRSEKTVKAYQCAIRTFAKFLKRPGVLRDLSSSTLSDFAYWRIKNSSVGSTLRDLDCLFAMANHAWKHGKINQQVIRSQAWQRRALKGGVA
jgi:hypothetical protein